MKSQWLHQNNHPDLLVFWNGWGMDARPFEHLSAATHDVLMIYDYRDLALPEDLAQVQNHYQHIRQIAWSFGVWAAGAWAKTAPAHASFDLAVNGTSEPVHPIYGIPPQAINEMANELTTVRRDQFYCDMFTEAPEAERFLARPPARSISEQQEELLALVKATNLQPAPFTAAWIGSLDRIILAKRQHRYWKDRCPRRASMSGHFPFYFWNTWEDVLSNADQR